MIDQYGRTLDYLRLSLTERCNLRCRYCRGEGSHPSIIPLSDEALLRLLTLFQALGIRKIKLTGGEPLLRPHFLSLAYEICGMGFDSVTLTTNGLNLPPLIPDLVKMGLNGVTISLDTLDAQRYRELTGRDGLETVLHGIYTCCASGLTTRVNCVPLLGFNDDELEKLAGLAKELPLSFRFIERMPMGAGTLNGISTEQIRRRLARHYGPPLPSSAVGNGPAVYETFPGFTGSVGYISALSEPFCAACNRLRLTSDGKLKPCLCYDQTYDLRPFFSLDDEAFKEKIQEFALQKPAKHDFDQPSQRPEMWRFGG